MSRGETIHDLMQVIIECFEQINIEISPSKLEFLVIMLYRSLTRKERFFHSIKHVFDLTEHQRPILSLAALFHDQVYYQIDGGFTTEVRNIINPFIREEIESPFILGKVFLKDELPNDDMILQLNLEIFGFKSGCELNPLGGLNEFLSALVMSKSLQNLLPLKSLVKMITFIEGSIPFRGENLQGESHFQTLAHTLNIVNQKFNLEYSEQELDLIIQEAVYFANKDVLNFSEEDPRDFLDNTWSLIPETNMSLRNTRIYNIQAYRQALQKMEGFFLFLNPKHIFHQYNNVPTDEELSILTQRAQINVEIARDYLKIKVLTSSIIEAFAIATGGDCPICLFMGSLPQAGVPSKRLESYLPPIEMPPVDSINLAIWQLLHKGRKKESNFDIKNAPLSLFIYASCSMDDLDLFSKDVRAMFRDEIKAEEFLNRLPHALISPIAYALTEMVTSRKEKFLQFT
jgi:hypothetical protein